LFGGEVTVAGLVPGENIAAALAGTAADRVVLPRSMFDVTGELTIDGLSPQLIADRLGIEVAVGSSPRELIRLSTETKGPIAMIYLPMRQIRHQAASAE
ncbi:MAG: hypothetical protein QOF51_1320, partial [Chloroflexota bacterium]|nr:hypothetical protein [Chloroflexota bacterium]